MFSQFSRANAMAPFYLSLICLFSLTMTTGCGDSVENDLSRQGLHLSDLQIGEGAEVVDGDYIEIRYRAWVYKEGAKGRELDATGEDALGLALGENDFIPGAETALVGMKVGGTRQVILSPEQGVGRGRPRGAYDNDTLIYEFELVSVVRIVVNDLTVGDGEELNVGDFVLMHYTGWIYEDGQKGEQFDSSRELNDPFGLMVGAGMVIKGWDIGLPGMRLGGTRQLIIPPQLAYGKRGQGSIPGGATLLFEVEAVSKPDIKVETLQTGEGAPAVAGHRIKMHMAGWVKNDDGSKGEQFQDTRNQGNALSVMLGSFKLLPGLEMGLQGIRPGEIRRLTVPSELAFGSRGFHRGDRTLVPPDIDVIIEVEVVQ